MIKETEIRLDGGVLGTLAEPANGSKRIAFILHGVGGHRDYCYQKMLGIALPEKCDISTFRIDFRGCGQSDDIEDRKQGRSVGGTDYTDLDNCYKHFTALGYNVFAIVGHSRGASVMFLWCLRNPHIYIPYLINCSGRFHTWEYRDRVYKEQPYYQRDQGYSLVARRFGEYSEQWIPMHEVDEFCSWDSYKYGAIDKRTQVLTMFGQLDHHVPARDCAYWANLFSGRHTLNVVLGADHNFYGGRDTAGKKINFNSEVVDTAVNWLMPSAQLERFDNTNQRIQVTTRWKQVEGVENLRDFGGYANLRSGILFRSAHLDGITEEGKKELKGLGIKHIFDFRSLAEGDDRPSITGVEIHRTPVFAHRNMSPEALAKRYAPMLGKDDVRGFEHSYMEILEGGRPAFKTILECIRDHPGEGVLVHCTAGKDRTGIFCATLLMALGVDKYTACREYELTTIGWKEQREIVAAALARQLKDQGIADADIQHMLSSKFDSMYRALDKMESIYKSAYDYFLACGMTQRDMTRISVNLTRNML